MTDMQSLVTGSGHLPIVSITHKTIEKLIDHDAKTIERFEQSIIRKVCSARHRSEEPMNEDEVRCLQLTTHWLIDVAGTAYRFNDASTIAESIFTGGSETEDLDKSELAYLAEDLLGKVIILASNETRRHMAFFYTTSILPDSLASYPPVSHTRARAKWEELDSLTAIGMGELRSSADPMDVVRLFRSQCRRYLIGLDGLVAGKRMRRSEVLAALYYLQAWALELGSTAILVLRRKDLLSG